MQSEAPWPYVDPEAFILIPANAQNKKYTTFKVKKAPLYTKAPILFEWQLAMVISGAFITLVGITVGL